MVAGVAFSQNSNGEKAVSSGIEQTSESQVIDETLIPLSTSDNNAELSEINISGTSSSTSSFGIYIRMILMLAVVIALIYILFRFLKANSIVPMGEDSQFLRSVASISIGTGKSVQVITLVDSAFLIGVTDNSVNLISKIEDKELINALNLYADKNSNKNKPKNFADVLDIFMPRKNQATQRNVFSTGSVFNDGSTSEILESIKNKSKRLEDEV